MFRFTYGNAGVVAHLLMQLSFILILANQESFQSHLSLPKSPLTSRCSWHFPVRAEEVQWSFQVQMIVYSPVWRKGTLILCIRYSKTSLFFIRLYTPIR
jgi:hypothetical protein